MKSFNIAVVRFMLTIFLLAGVLAACGETRVSSPTATATIVIPTATVTTMPTAAPTPTPVPIPTKFILGEANNPWGEIARYEENPSDQLQEIKLDANLKQELGVWLQDAPKLAATNISLTAPKVNSTFTIKLLPATVSQLFSGNFRLVDITAKINVIFNNISAISPWSLGAILSPSTIFQLASSLVSLPYLNSINEQYKEINANLATVKNFLYQKEYSNIVGKMEYLNSMQKALNEQKLSELDLVNLRTQLENIEVETTAALHFARSQMENAQQSFDRINLDKNLFVFRNESAVNDLIRQADEFKIHADNYYVAVSVKGLAAQILCAIPASRELAILRLEDTRVKLESWQDIQFNFFETIGNTVPKLDGLFSDKKKPNSLIAASNEGQAWANNGRQKLDPVLADTIQKVKIQKQLSSEPMTIVVELDDQAKIVKVSNLGKA